MTPSPAAARCVRTWVRDALRIEDGEGSAPARTGPEATAAAEADLLQVIAAQRVVELLHAHARALALPGDLTDRLEQVRAVNGRRRRIQLLELRRAEAVLAAAGVPHLFFKGPALAAQTTGDPDARAPGDLDVLVPPRSAGTARAVLGRAGWCATDTAPRPGSWAWRWLGDIYGAQTLRGAGSVLDLHWRLDATLDALPGFDELWDRRQVVEVAGRKVATLGPRDALAHSCLHAAKDEWCSLRSLVDVHRLARMCDLDGSPPVRMEVSTLSVVRDLVGLPADPPQHVAALLDRVPPGLSDRARRAQEGRARTGRHGAALWLTRYQWQASGSARDTRRLLASMVLPADHLDGLTGRHAGTALPQAVGRRVYRMIRRQAAHSS